MIIYLAARYGRFEEMQRYRTQLHACGFQVSSRWINGAHKMLDADPGERGAQFAADDWADLISSDAVISFTEPSRTVSNSRGGRHVEFGIALGFTRMAARAPWFKSRPFRLIVVGHRENVFHWLPEVEFYETWGECLEALRNPSTIDREGDAVEGAPV